MAEFYCFYLGSCYSPEHSKINHEMPGIGLQLGLRVE